MNTLQIYPLSEMSSSSVKRLSRKTIASCSVMKAPICLPSSRTTQPSRIVQRYPAPVFPAGGPNNTGSDFIVYRDLDLDG
jgi:hypothetical protein